MKDSQRKAIHANLRRTYFNKKFAEEVGLDQHNRDIENEDVYIPSKRGFDDYNHPDFKGAGRHTEHSRYNTNASVDEDGNYYDSISKTPLREIDRFRIKETTKPNGITKDEMTKLHAFTMGLSGDEAHDNFFKKEFTRRY